MQGGLKPSNKNIKTRKGKENKMTHSLSHSITLAACTDCYFYFHYSDYLINDDFNTEHLSEEDKQNIISGFNKNSEDYNISELDNDSNDTHFSWSNCDMCGSSLGGDRHELLLTPIAPPPAPQDSKGSICDENTSISRKIFKGTREEYLMAGVKELSKLFKQAGHTVPKDVKVTMSLPTKNARPSKIQTIGQCFARSASDGGINEILITPLLNNSVDVLSVLTHELVHAIDDCTNGHKAPFKRIAEAVGLEGKMTNTIAGEELTEKIKAIVKKLGRYPHKKLNLSTTKQSTRLILISCGRILSDSISSIEPCGAKMRVSRKVIDESTVWLGSATCPFCGSVGTLIEGKVENCEGDLIALTEERTVFGTEYTYPANKLARQFAEISGQKTLSAYTISRMERMGVKVMNELEYYKQQAGVENS